MGSAKLGFFVYIFLGDIVFIHVGFMISYKKIMFLIILKSKVVLFVLDKILNSQSL